MTKNNLSPSKSATHPAPLAATAASLRSGKIDLKTSLDNRLRIFDEFEPQVEALLPEAKRRSRLLKEAEALEARYADHKEERPPLYGILLGVKDIYRVDGFPSQCGTTLPAEEFAGAEAVCVTKLKAAGALVLGKTVSTECAYFEPGPTRNPCNLEHTPGGSSSGSAAAVAAGFCELAFGSQTNGSTIRPAAYCGIVGYKPSFGRIDTEGLLHFSRALDHVGLFTQDVAGMELAASLLCDQWKPVNDSHRMPVLGVPEGAFLQQASTERLAAFQEQLDRLSEAGYEIRQVRTLEEIDAISHRHLDMMGAGLATEHAHLFDKYRDRYRPLTVSLMKRGLLLSDAVIGQHKKAQADLRDSLQTQMGNSGIDLWVTPAAPAPAPKGIHATGNPAMNLPWTHVGLPVITVPAGNDAAERLPLGLQLIAPFGKDEQLLTWADPIGQVFTV